MIIYRDRQADPKPLKLCRPEASQNKRAHLELPASPARFTLCSSEWQSEDRQNFANIPSGREGAVATSPSGDPERLSASDWHGGSGGDYVSSGQADPNLNCSWPPLAEGHGADWPLTAHQSQQPNHEIHDFFIDAVNVGRSADGLPWPEPARAAPAAAAQHFRARDAAAAPSLQPCLPARSPPLHPGRCPEWQPPGTPSPPAQRRRPRQRRESALTRSGPTGPTGSRVRALRSQPTKPRSVPEAALTGPARRCGHPKWARSVAACRPGPGLRTAVFSTHSALLTR